MLGCLRVGVPLVFLAQCPLSDPLNANVGAVLPHGLVAVPRFPQQHPGRWHVRRHEQQILHLGMSLTGLLPIPIVIAEVHMT